MRQHPKRFQPGVWLRQTCAETTRPIVIACVAALCQIVAATHAFAEAEITMIDVDCEDQVKKQPEVKALRKEIARREEGLKGLVHWAAEEYAKHKEGLTGMVNIGKCAWSLYKLTGEWEGPKTYSETKDEENEIACLKLKIIDLKNKCICNAMGLHYSPDDSPDGAVKDEVSEAYDYARKSADKLAEKGIKDKAVREWVARAGKIKHCLTKDTLFRLHNLTEALDHWEPGRVPSISPLEISLPFAPGSPPGALPEPKRVKLPTEPAAPSKVPLRPVPSGKSYNPESTITGIPEDAAKRRDPGAVTPTPPEHKLSPPPGFRAPAKLPAPPPSAETPSTITERDPGGINLDVRPEGHPEDLDRGEVLKLLKKPGS